jgi:hypothetical protein
MRPSVIFVREWEQQMSSSGCCGRLEGDMLVWGGERCFPERRKIMEDVGALYRAVRDRYGDAVEICVVDPRNLPSLFMTLLGDFRRYGVSLPEALRAVLGITVNSVIVNGRLASRDGRIAPARLFLLIEASDVNEAVIASPSLPSRGS